MGEGQALPLARAGACDHCGRTRPTPPPYSHRSPITCMANATGGPGPFPADAPLLQPHRDMLNGILRVLRGTASNMEVKHTPTIPLPRAVNRQRLRLHCLGVSQALLTSTLIISEPSVTRGLPRRRGVAKNEHSLCSFVK